MQWDYFFTQGNPAVTLFELCGNSSARGCGLAGLDSGNFNYTDQVEVDVSGANFFIGYAVTGATPGTWTGGSGDGGGGSDSTAVPEPGVFTLQWSGGLFF